MKKIFVFILLITSLAGFGQIIQPKTTPLFQQQGSQTTWTQINGILYSVLGYVPATWSDTSTANLNNYVRTAPGILIRVGNTIYQRNSTATKWIVLGGSGSITNISFNTDSTMIICYSSGVCDTISFNNTINNSITNIYNNSITNIFVYHDSCVILQTGAGINVDTICTQFDCGISGWTITNDSTIQICGFICPDTTTIVCDNFHFPPQHFYLFDNGLTQVSAGHVQLGGDLINPLTNIHTNYNRLLIQGRPVGGYPLTIDQYQNWGNGGGVLALSMSASTGTKFRTSYATSPWRRADQPGGYVPGPIEPYKGYYSVVNGNYVTGRTLGLMDLDDNTAKLPYMIFHDKDTSNNIGLSFGVLSPPYSGTTSTANMGDSIALNILYNGKIQLPQYIHTSDANTDSAFYRDALGVLQYGKVNGGGGVPTLQQVFNTEVGGSILTKNDTINTVTDGGIKIIGNSAGIQVLRVTNAGAGATILASNSANGGIAFQAQATGSTGTNTGASISAIATGSISRALFLQAAGGTSNYALSVNGGKVVIGANTGNASALLEVTSTTQGFSPPSMSTGQMSAISSPATGLEVYNTTQSSIAWYNGATWNGTNLLGTATNDNAVAGNMGEYVSSLVAIGSSVSLSNGTAANITSISLTAGDWDVEGQVTFADTTSTVTARTASIGSTSATLATDGSEGYCGVQSTLTSEINTITLARKRFSLSGTTTIYLVGKETFSAGNCGGFGVITARRVR